jgi:hypothetical protein
VFRKHGEETMKRRQRPVDSQSARRKRLLTLTALNLLLWIVVASAVVLLVSRRVDVGVETFFREGPATLIAYVRGFGQQPASGTTEPDETAQAAPDLPTGTSQPAPVFPTSERTQPSEQVAGGSATITPLPTEEKSTPEPTTQLLTYPLNLSDPALDSVLDMGAQMGSSAVGRRVQIEYTEEALNREVVGFLERYPFLPYKRVSVELEQDRVTVKGDVTLQGITASVEVAGRVGTRDCQPWADMDDLKIAGMPTPGLFREGIEQLLQDAVHWFPPDHPLCLEWIIVDEDQVTIYASRR